MYHRSVLLILFAISTLSFAADSKVGEEDNSNENRHNRALTSAPKLELPALQNFPDRKISASSSKAHIIFSRPELRPARSILKWTPKVVSIHDEQRFLRMNVINSIKALDTLLDGFYPRAPIPNFQVPSLMTLHLKALSLARVHYARKFGPLNSTALKYSVIIFEIRRLVQVLQKYDTQADASRRRIKFCLEFKSKILDLSRNLCSAINSTSREHIKKVLIPQISGADLINENTALFNALEVFDSNVALQCDFPEYNSFRIDKIREIMDSYLALAFKYDLYL